MAKVSARNIQNALRRIGIDEFRLQGVSMFPNAITNYQISLGTIQDILNKNPNINNFKLLKSILDDVIAINKENHLALFSCYQLLGKYANEDGEADTKSLNELAIKHHLDWKLTGEYPYAMIITKCNCATCVQLDGYCDSIAKVKQTFLDSIEECESGMSKNTVVTFAESYYLRHRKQ
jgi:hypothetical protein